MNKWLLALGKAILTLLVVIIPVCVFVIIIQHWPNIALYIFIGILSISILAALTIAWYDDDDPRGDRY